MRLNRTITLVLLPTLVLTLTGGGGAVADTGSLDAVELVGAIEENRPDSSSPMADNPYLDIPDSAEAPIVLETGEFGDQISVELPDSLTDSKAVALDDEAIVYESDTGTDFAVQSTEEGFRVTAKIEEDHPKDQTYDFGDDVFLELNDDGGVDINQIQEVPEVGAEIISTIGSIEAPWATDATGEQVETYYQVTGSELTQVVVTDDDTQYPVLADPEVKRVNLVQLRVRFNRAETKTMAGGTTPFVGAGCIAAVSAASLAPPLAVALSAACTVAAGTLMWHANMAENSRPKKCVQIHFTPVPGPAPTAISWVNTYSGGYCR